MGLWHSEILAGINMWAPTYVTCQKCGTTDNLSLVHKSGKPWECTSCGKDPRIPPEEWLGKHLAEKLRQMDGPLFQGLYWRKKRQELLAFAGFGFELREKKSGEIVLLSDDWSEITHARQPHDYEADSTGWWREVNPRYGTKHERAGDAERKQSR